MDASIAAVRGYLCYAFPQQGLVNWGNVMICSSRFFRAVLLAAIAATWTAGGASAQLPYRVGARALWHEPAGAGTTNCEGRDNDVRRQLHCVIVIMKQSGATGRAVEFTRRFSAKLGEICFLSNLQSFGPVALATVAVPFRRNTNAHTDSEFAIVNGDPGFIRVDDNEAVRSVLAGSPAFLQLKSKHPNIDIWEGTVFEGTHGLPGGGHQFVFSYPLGEYHAEAGRWNASVAFDFAPGGAFAGRKVLTITGQRR
jgi:hypothetical protein